MSETVTAIIVSYADPDATVRALESLREQSVAPVELLVVDNDPGGASARRLAAQSDVRVLRSGANIGYTRAVNLAADEAHGDWLLLLNPDVVAAPDCLQQLLGAVDGPDVALVGAQILLRDGRVNAGENPINLVGVSWSGRYGMPREHGAARDSAAVSGAALIVRRAALIEAGGLCPYFFMYVDDSDLAWRLRLRGMRVRYCPSAVVTHEYEFDKGPHKWFYLERNRAWALLSNLRLRTLALLAVPLLIAELAIIARAIYEGWLAEKVRAWASLLIQMPALIRWRGSVQAGRVVSDYEVLSLFAAGIETELIETRLPRWVGAVAERQRRLLLRALAALRA